MCGFLLSVRELPGGWSFGTLILIILYHKVYTIESLFSCFFFYKIIAFRISKLMFFLQIDRTYNINSFILSYELECEGVMKTSSCIV